MSMHTSSNLKFIYSEKTTNGQRVYEKICSITNYQGNANKKRNEISPMLVRMTVITKNITSVVEIWINWDLCAQLV